MNSKKIHVEWLLAVAVLGLMVSGCATSKRMTYLLNMQADSAYVAANAPEIRLQKNDRLTVNVFSEEAELAKPFNLTTGGEVSKDASYLVENDGCIDFPVIGRVPVEGCTFKECEKQIADRISEIGYIKSPVVNVALENFTVTVLGETGNSVLTVEQDKINLLQVLAMSGGLQASGDIKKVMVIRTENGLRTAHTVNLQNASLFNSPVFYLQQNDIVYVRPKALKITPTGETLLSFLGTGLSAATLIAYLMVYMAR